jgi:hypothetical protein
MGLKDFGSGIRIILSPRDRWICLVFDLLRLLISHDGDLDTVLLLPIGFPMRCMGNAQYLTCPLNSVDSVKASCLGIRNARCIWSLN